ncbi:MAG: glycosyltransferase family 1 protein [bacterium]
MIIGLDARWIFREISGIGMVTRELIRELPRLAPADQFVLYFHDSLVRDRTISETGVNLLPNIRSVLLKQDIFDPVSQLTMPHQLRRDCIDLYHSTNYMLPLLAFSSRLTRRPVCVLTIHDLIPLLAPQETPHAIKTRLLPVFRCLLNSAVRRADAILTPSEASRTDLLRALRIPAARHASVVRVYNGVSPLFSPDTASDVRTPQAADDVVRPRRLLYVGRADPYKNLPALVEAFALARRRAPWPLQLTILGTPDTRYPEATVRATALGLGPDAIHWTGYCDAAATLAAYRAADLLVHPARHEGFGLPVVEAMATGLPVLANDIPVLREVAGDSAGFADANLPDLFAQAMLDLLHDHARLSALRAAGLLRAAAFTWRRAAMETLAVYRVAVARLDKAH